MSYVCQLREQSEGGVWVVYGLDHSYHFSTTVFADELSALRHAQNNYMTVGFLQWGCPLSDATSTSSTAAGHDNGRRVG